MKRQHDHDHSYKGTHIIGTGSEVYSIIVMEGGIAVHRQIG